MPIFAVVVILIIASSVIFAFVYPLIVAKKLKAIQAIKLSAKAAIGNVWGLLGIMVLNIALSWAGMLFCYIGAFLVMPITFAAQYKAYRQVFEHENA